MLKLLILKALSYQNAIKKENMKLDTLSISNRYKD